MRYNITLIHGTFARGAEWTRDNSPFCTLLREALSASVTFHRFQWSGKNSPSARLKAAEQLKVHLRQVLDIDPQATHYIIAHSHGGNIALYALQDSGLQEKIAGVVCLSTPFLHVRNRWFPPLALVYPRILVSILLSILCWVTLVVLLLLISEAIRSPRGGMVYGGLDRFLINVVGWLSYGLIFAAVNEGVKRVQQRWMTMADNIRARHSHPRLSSNKLLILRSVADEASAALGTAQFVNWLLGSTLSQLYKWDDSHLDAAMGDPEGKARAVSILTGFFVLLFGGETFFGRTVFCVIAFGIANFMVEMRHFYAKILLTCATVVIVLPTVLTMCILLLLPFGLQFALSNILLEVSAEPAPVGDWTVHQLPASASAYSLILTKGGSTQAGRNSLMHSSVYEDPDAILLITAWIDRDNQRF
jgi:hypothetical protein